MTERSRRVRSTQESASATGLAARGGGAEEKGRGSEAPAGREETPAMGHGRAEETARIELPGSVLRRSRQMIARVIGMYGGRIQRGKSDGA